MFGQLLVSVIVSVVLAVGDCHLMGRLNSTIIGRTNVLLNNTVCWKDECNMANFINDAMVNALAPTHEVGSWTQSAIAASNAGCFQSTLSELKKNGVITYGNLLAVQPWGNTFDIIELQGQHLLEALELSATKRGTSGFMHWSGLQVTYDMSRPVNKRVVESSILCRTCRVPRFEPIVPLNWYRVTMNSYLVEGDDGYSVFTRNHRNRVTGRLDMDVVMDYMYRKGPITNGLDGRIKLRNAPA